jgi:hypothetical protein
MNSVFYRVVVLQGLLSHAPFQRDMFDKKR